MINSNIATNKKYNKMKSLNEEIKISQFKRNKEQDEIKNTPSIKNIKVYILCFFECNFLN